MKALILHTGFISINSLEKLYIQDIIDRIGISVEVLGLYSNSQNKSTAKEKEEWISQNHSIINSYDYLLISDGDYFKKFTGVKKVVPYVGTICHSKFTTAKILYIPNVYKFKFNPEEFNSHKELALQTLYKDISGSSTDKDIVNVKTMFFPKSIDEIKSALNNLKQYPALTVDIESTSLKLSDTSIYTIAFAWDKYNGIAFPVESHSDPETIKQSLKTFFEEYQGKLIAHKANFDFMVLIWHLWQEEQFNNIKGQLKGLSTLGKNFDDTLIITYLATNSCAGNILGLKELASEFAGDWSMDVSDVTKVNLDDLLRYNLIDALSTWFVKEKYTPRMIGDNQENLYEEKFKPYLLDCIRMQLNGSPIDPEEVKELGTLLHTEANKAMSIVSGSREIKITEQILTEEATNKRNAKLKTKVTTWADNQQEFNINSGKHLQVLLYQVMGLPIIERTPNNAPCVDKKTIRFLKNHTENENYQIILDALADYMDVNKIITAFLPAFENPSTDKNGVKRLTGYFNLGGTVSGRMSSSNINLQQLPSTGSKYSKPVKKCFTSSNGWLFVGYDFASLEDKIDALKTRDSNKMKTYLEGYDGHSLRAYYYFKNNMPDIQLVQDGEVCYICTIKGKEICFKESDTINFKGKKYSGKEFYDLVANKKL